jgi:Icc-related predicted phosphoesterase
MHFAYVTDLHGSITKYNLALKYAIDHKVPLIHIGADVLPKGSCIMEMQKDFIKKYLKDFYRITKEKGIDVIGSFGNDDLNTRKQYFRKYATLLDEVPYEKDGYTFKAYNFVPDYPFGLKGDCKLDYPGWTCPEPYISPPVDFTDQGRVIIEDPVQYFLKKGTIKEDLEKIQVDDRTIMAIHCPPAGGLGLDVCANGREVGSKSVLEFIAAKKPLLTLHGHVHESPDVTGIWKTQIGKTVVIQPGQRTHGLTLVDIEIHDSTINAQLIHLD